jgi:hypothetical protein
MTNALKIVEEYEVDFGNVVGANEFSYGHEAGQIHAASRIAEMIRYHEAASPSVALLRRLRAALPPTARREVASDTDELVDEIDAFLSSLGSE